MKRTKESVQEIRGSLEQHGLPDVMRRIYTERRTGELLISRGAVRRRVFFETGRAVFAASNRKGDRLGEFLLRRGDIRQDVFDMVNGMVPQGRRFGQMLVEMGLLSQEKVIKAVHEQILALICSLFEWPKGEFEFIERATTNVPADLKLELSMAEIMLEGVGRIRDVAVVRRGMGDLNRLIGPHPDPLLRMQQASLKPQEKALLAQIVEPTDLLSIMVFSQQGAADTIRALYGLLSAGFLTWVVPRTEAVQPVITVLEEDAQTAEAISQSADVSAPALSSIAELSSSAPLSEKPADRQAASSVTAATVVSSPAQKDHDEALRREVAEIRARIGTGDPYAVFALTSDADMEQLRAAYYDLLRCYHPDKFRQAPRKLREEVEEIFKQINIAWSFVQQEARHKEMPGKTPSPSATASVVSQTPISTTHDNARPTQAVWADVASGRTMPETRQISAQEMQKAAELSYRSGISSLLAKNYQDAVEHFKRAVNIDPENPCYHSLAGLAMYSLSPRSNPKVCREAEQHYLEAIRLDPQEAHHHALLGLLYARLGMIRRADAVYRQALQLDPNNEIALNGLASRPVGFELLLHVMTRS